MTIRWGAIGMRCVRGWGQEGSENRAVKTTRSKRFPIDLKNPTLLEMKDLNALSGAEFIKVSDPRLTVVRFNLAL